MAALLTSHCFGFCLLIWTIFWCAVSECVWHLGLLSDRRFLSRLILNPVFPCTLFSIYTICTPLSATCSFLPLGLWYFWEGKMILSLFFICISRKDPYDKDRLIEEKQAQVYGHVLIPTYRRKCSGYVTLKGDALDPGLCWISTEDSAVLENW